MSTSTKKSVSPRPRSRRRRLTGRRLRVAFAVLAGLVLLEAGRTALWRPLAVEGPPPSEPRGYARVSGVVHVHTTQSDGGGSVEEVVAAAADAGLDFVVVTDHNTFSAESSASYRDGVLLIVGTEITTDSGHLLGVGLSPPEFRFSGDASDVIGDVDELGGSTFVAHPTSPRDELRWTDWELPGAWGLEILNADTQWRVASKPRALATILRYPLNPGYALLGLVSRPTGFERWDRLLAVRDAPVLMGSDAHSLAGATGVRWPSYRAIFELARNHLFLAEPLTGDGAADSAAIVEALRNGRGYVGVDGLAPANGFFFVADDGPLVHTMGETVAPGDRLELRAGGRLPEGARLSLIRDGETVETAERALSFRANRAGVYRIEVELPGWELPWIVSNPIYVLNPDAAETRVRSAAVPPPSAPGSPLRLLDDFEGETTFQLASDVSTSVDATYRAAGDGIDGGTALRLAFELGPQTEEHPFPYAAFVSMGPRDLSGAAGLALAVRADGPVRLFVQVRDRNPDSADGTEWWFASIKAGPEWRQVAVPFDRFRTRDPASDGRLDLDRVEGLVLLVDRGALHPGHRGVIWIDDLAVY